MGKLMALKRAQPRECRHGTTLVHRQDEKGFWYQPCPQCQEEGAPGPPDFPYQMRWGSAYIVESDGAHTYGPKEAS